MAFRPLLMMRTKGFRGPFFGKFAGWGGLVKSTGNAGGCGFTMVAGTPDGTTFGYLLGGYGSLDPDNLNGVQIERLITYESGEVEPTVDLHFAGDIQPNGAMAVNVEIDGVRERLGWDGVSYTVASLALANAISDGAESGDELCTNIALDMAVWAFEGFGAQQIRYMMGELHPVPVTSITVNFELYMRLNNSGTFRGLIGWTMDFEDAQSSSLSVFISPAGELTFRMYAAGNVPVDLTFPGALKFTTWFDVEATYDVASDAMTLTVDGVSEILVGAGVDTGHFSTAAEVDVLGTPSRSNAIDLQMGNMSYDVDGTDYLVVIPNGEGTLSRNFGTGDHGAVNNPIANQHRAKDQGVNVVGLSIVQTKVPA